MQKTLLIHGTVITMNPSRQIIKDGGVYVEGDRIAAIGPASSFEALQADQVIDATGQVIIPGLINAHTHTGYFIMRGLGMSYILLDWLQYLIWPWLRKMDTEDVYTTSLLSYVECLKSGTTALIDNQYYSKLQYENYDAAATAAQASGLRVNFACGYSDVSFICPPEFIDTPANIEAEVRRMIRTWHGKGKIQVCVAPINLLYASDDTIHRGLKIMEDTGVSMHTHVAESKKEYEAIVERFGMGYIEAFHSMGALSDHFQSAHTVWISDHEIDLLAQAGATMCYNPVCNMLLASGIAPVTKMQAAGVNVALGTDNPNNNNDMLESMKFAGLLQKVGTLDPLATPATAVLEMATLNGARALRMSDQIGSLEVGKQADIVTVDYRVPRNTPLHDPIAMLVYSANGSDVRNVLVAGQLLVKDSRVTFLDEDALVTKAQARADRLAEMVPAR